MYAIQRLPPPFLLLGGIVVLLFVGCEDGGYPPPAAIAFRDTAPANSETPDDLAHLPLVDAEGMPIDLNQYRGKKHVVLVMTRGFTGSQNQVNGKSVGGICIYCSTQTARLMANYPSFAKQDAEVLVVFPVVRSEDAEQLRLFTSAVKREASTEKEPPFPLAIDVELKAVDRLGIRADLSKPATYILDKAGRVRYAYVGSSLSDRPSVKALLAELSKLNQSGT
jgi:peroxiredoxin